MARDDRVSCSPTRLLGSLGVGSARQGNRYEAGADGPDSI
jgi:hypothetical protein